jgi:hypothetical protein
VPRYDENRTKDEFYLGPYPLGWLPERA